MKFLIQELKSIINNYLRAMENEDDEYDIDLDIDPDTETVFVPISVAKII